MVSRFKRPRGTRPISGAPAQGRGGVGGRHGRVHAGLVQEHEPGRVHARAYLGPPALARRCDVLASLLARVQGFLRGSPRRASARHTAARLGRPPPAHSARRAAYWASVASLCSSTNAASARGLAPPSARRPPPCGLGPRRPSPRAAASQLQTAPTLTPNRAAKTR